jgi:hypothetical protein
MTNEPRRRGSVLLVALGLLAVLSVFAVSFASILRLEARAAANVSDATRARLVAEAGLDRALFLLTASELRDPVTSFHAAWTYRSQDGAGWGLGLPLDQARNPSFRQGVTPEGLAHSGIVSGSYRAGGDHFVLRVTAANSRLSLNGEQPTLRPMLEALGRAIAEFDRRRLDASSPLFDPGWGAWLQAERAELVARGVPAAEAQRRTEPFDPLAGRVPALLNLRASLGGRFQSLEQLGAVLPPAELERLCDYVTCDAWLDPAMVGFDASGAETPQLRAPVDVNTAPWPVLVACLEGVLARTSVHPAEAPRAIDPATARRLATRIDQRRRGVRAGAVFASPGEPFRGWNDLRPFLAQDPGLDLTQVAALLANADPNLIYPQRNPDATNHPGLGKVDLAYATTELCFISFGVYEITSLARILAPDGTLAAQHTAHVVAQVYDTLRLLTQADFESARTSNELEKTASFPNPVRAVTGSFRVQPAGDGQQEVIFEPLFDPDLRRRLRVQASSRTSGWVQLIADEPTRPFAPENFAGGDLQWDAQGNPTGSTTMSHMLHLFRFGADLRGELWDFVPGNAVIDPPPPPGWNPRVDTPDGSYLLYWRQRICDRNGRPIFDVPTRDGPAPDLVDRVQAFAVATGTGPGALGLDPPNDPADATRWQELQTIAAQLHPPGARLTYAEDLAPDGLLIHPDRRTDLRYRVEWPGAGARSLLQNNSGLLLWFKLNLSLLETWTPLLEAWHPVEGHPWIANQQRANGPKTFKFQVEARLIHAPSGDGYQLEVRSRRVSLGAAGQLAPLEIWDPDNPDDQRVPAGIDFNAPYYSRHVSLGLDEARAGEWHYLYIPHYGNVHFPFVDGLAGRILETVATDTPGAAVARWPLPAWPDELQDRVAPGGFVYPGMPARPRFAEATIDEMLCTNYQRNLTPPSRGGDYDRNRMTDMVRGYLNVTTRRYTPWGPDHSGSFTAELPAFDADQVKLGRIVWTELQPARWGLKQYDGGDFQTQGAYRYSTEAQRDHLGGRALSPPNVALMGDEYVRFWRLVYIDERIAALTELVLRYADLLAGAAPEAAPTYQAYHDTFAGERAALEAEKQAILDRWGAPVAPPDGGASVAFGAGTEVTPGARRVRLRLDFLYFDKAQQSAQPPIGRDGQEWWTATSLNVSPIIDDVIVPYQERPRLLRRWDE